MRGKRKTQLTLRLPDDVVALIDEFVEMGSAASRAEAVATMIACEHRRRLQDRDVAIYAAEALKEPSEEEKSYQGWLTTRRYPPLDDTDWEAVTGVTAASAPHQSA